MKNKKTQHKFARRRVTFEDMTDQTLWRLGDFGQSNAVIRGKTGETNGQIHYRLRLLKNGLGLDESLRNRWKNGHHPLMRQLMQHAEAIQMAELRRKVIPKLVHPVPETVNI